MIYTETYLWTWEIRQNNKFPKTFSCVKVYNMPSTRNTSELKRLPFSFQNTIFQTNSVSLYNVIDVNCVKKERKIEIKQNNLDKLNICETWS